MRAGAEQEQIDPNAPIRLTEIISIAFPMGGMTVSGLRRERDRGRLAIERIAGREFTTLRAIEEMRRLCLDPRKGHAFTSSSQTDDQAIGSSETASISRERAALRETLRELNERSKTTSAKSGVRADQVVRIR